MTGAKLGNCRNCGKLYIRVRDVCDECIEKQEKDYIKVSAFLREHPGSTIPQASEATGVTTMQIRQFILSKRIEAKSFPNLSYPCQTCGIAINEGTSCGSCLITAQKMTDSGRNDGKPEKDLQQKALGYISRYL